MIIGQCVLESHLTDRNGSDTGIMGSPLVS